MWGEIHDQYLRLLAWRTLSHPCRCFLITLREEQDLKKLAHCVMKLTYFQRQRFHQKKLRCVMTVASITWWHKSGAPLLRQLQQLSACSDYTSSIPNFSFIQSFPVQQQIFFFSYLQRGLLFILLGVVAAILVVNRAYSAIIYLF